MRALTEREDRRLAKYVPSLRPDECWPWQGPMSSNGYGVFNLDKRELVAHRAVYQRVNGTLPAEAVLDHLCRNPRCVNPAHLEPVSQRVNTLRGDGPTAKNAQKTHCSRGHEYTPDNTRVRKGSRSCRQCIRQQLREQWKRGARKHGPNNGRGQKPVTRDA